MLYFRKRFIICSGQYNVKINNYSSIFFSSALCYTSGNILIYVQVSSLSYYRKYSSICSCQYNDIFQEAFLYLFRSVLGYISGNIQISDKVFYISKSILISVQVGTRVYFGTYSNLCSGQYYVIFQETVLYLFGPVLCYRSGNIPYLFKSV